MSSDDQWLLNDALLSKLAREDNDEDRHDTNKSGGGAGSQFSPRRDSDPGLSTALGDLFTAVRKRVGGIQTKKHHHANSPYNSPHAQLKPQASHATYGENPMRSLFIKAFDFGTYPKSYCLFGSFRSITSRMKPYGSRPFEILGEAGNHIYQDYAIYTTVGARPDFTTEPSGANQIVLFNGGPSMIDTRIALMIRGYGIGSGILVDWVAFNFMRRLLSRLGANKDTICQTLQDSESVTAHIKQTHFESKVIKKSS